MRSNRAAVIRIGHNRLNVTICMSDEYETRWIDSWIGRAKYLSNIDHISHLLE